MRLTRRGLSVLGAAVVLYALGEIAGYVLLRALAGAAAGALLAGAAVTLRRPRVSVRREMPSNRIQRGGATTALLVVANPGGRRQPGFTAREQSGQGEVVDVHPLPPGASQSYAYKLTGRHRGRITVGPLSIERADPLGLVRRRITAGDTATLWVYPPLRPARAPGAGHPRHHHEGPTTDDSLHGSADLRDVREYVVGDEVRHLHWKATARTGTLMVRDYVDPDHPRFTLLLDTRPRVLSAAEFEEAVELAASLVNAAATAGHRCRLLTSSGADVATNGGTVAVRPLLDVLCEVAQDADGAMIPAALAGPGGRGGCLVVVTGRASRDLPGLAAVRSRFSALYVLGVGTHGLGMDGLGVHGIEGVRGARRISAPDAGEAVSRWNEMVS
ncbi:DUF58 domain-containing protein [Amycolatopsis australiensis]|uniref:Uncharacterized conserved protein, DUF58 family, contains vWF domain n=1 Tax=Amycolatopsis australiensis TaxID=546364 RepID=A0A1K1S1W0_9PSEU|nr:DUF58 domain-containing protein [Amycolatopsis australiensis]SFW78294.1 Uncharacterized conserved protein, DUF58 family, contains vWF domain [Amycolatopsis australiensis]